MKLGITYMVFDGEELLKFALQSIRNQIDHISVTYQTTSYFGNKSNPLPLLEQLKKDNLIDELIHYENDLSIHHKQNELNLRNLGVQASKKAGCTHHISADVDELYLPEQLAYCKDIMFQEKYDFSMAPYIYYYKKPTYQVYPNQNLLVSFIHPVENEYTMEKFPFKMERTRGLKLQNNYKVFSSDEITIHHMSYVRKDLWKKFANSDNAQYYKVKEFVEKWQNYKLGERICLLPDYLNRKTIEVPNLFGISID